MPATRAREHLIGRIRLSKNEHLVPDAHEMMTILQTAACMKRYDKISHELLSEILVAIATDGEVIGGNNRGSDVRSPSYGLIEVKSRILGTDGEFPRVSLKQANIDKAAWFAAVRWQRDFRLYDAVLLPKRCAAKLYEAKRQSRNLAHISWADWISNSEAVSIKERCIGLIAAQAASE